LIVFEDIDNNLIPLDSKQEMKEISLIETPRIAELEKELQITRESHQPTIEYPAIYCCPFVNLLILGWFQN
jgi:hypothetical protein